MVIVLRERGFFLQPATLASPDSVALMIRFGRGLTCFSVTPDRAMRLGLLLGGDTPDERQGGAFLRSVEAADCHGTGISAADRAITLRAAGAEEAHARRLKSPGHVLPVMVQQAELGSVPGSALALLRHMTPHEVPAWTDILDDDGELASPPICESIADRLSLRRLRLDV